MHTPQRLFLIRHGETAMAKAGRHTGRQDVPLTERGEQQARALAPLLARCDFARVLVSPLRRAQDTCRLAGFLDRADTWPDIAEWDYGDYEGRTSAEIAADIPGWNIWTHGVQGGETVEQVAARGQRTLDRLATTPGDIALFAHGHFLRILAATWLGLPPTGGRLLAMSPAAIHVLGYEGATRVLRAANWELAPHWLAAGTVI
jgi:probable phosphoglycerate mutase